MCTYTIVVKISKDIDGLLASKLIRKRLDEFEDDCFTVICARVFEKHDEALFVVYTKCDYLKMGPLFAAWLSETNLPPYPPMTLLWYR